MMKSGTTVIIVDQVDTAVKFYTEKLGFDIFELMSEPSSYILKYAHVRKGKCRLMFRMPLEEERVEFSQIKHASIRGVGVFADMKKGIEKYYDRCKKKKVTLVQDLRDEPWGYKTFAIRDPFGTRLVFGQPLEGPMPVPSSFLGLRVDLNKSDDELTDEMVQHLRPFRITRRPAKKYAKLWLKTVRAAKK